MSFSVNFTARFGDVDPAGIIYYARFLDFFHRALEAYFDDRLGLPYAQMVQAQRIGVPVVHVEGSFAIPVAFGELFSVEVRPKRLGGSSVLFEYTLRKPSAEGVCASFVITHVFTDLRSFRPMPIPDGLRARLSRDLLVSPAPLPDPQSESGE